MISCADDDVFAATCESYQEETVEAKQPWDTYRRKIVDGFKRALEEVEAILSDAEQGKKLFESIALVCLCERQKRPSKGGYHTSRFAGVVEGLRSVRKKHKESKLVQLALAIAVLGFAQMRQHSDLTV